MDYKELILQLRKKAKFALPHHGEDNSERRMLEQAADAIEALLEKCDSIVKELGQWKNNNLL